MEKNFCFLYLIKVPAIVHLWLFVIILPKKNSLIFWNNFLNHLYQLQKVLQYSKKFEVVSLGDAIIYSKLPEFG